MDHYNSVYGKVYTRSKCLDVERRNTKEPELLLEAPGETSIVLEHKSVVWPTRHLADHHNEHHLFGVFKHRLDLLGNPFKDSAYQLRISANALKGKRKGEVSRFAEQIAQVVLSDQPKAKSQCGIGVQKPISWRFRPLLPHERDETVPETDVVLEVRGTAESDELSEIFQGIERAKYGYTEEFERLAENATEKFARYADCMKLLLVQFHGDSSVMLPDEDIIGIIQSAQLPEMIDQVWLAHPDWVSEYDYEIEWDHVR